MTESLASLWIESLENIEDRAFLSNELGSWSYGDLRDEFEDSIAQLTSVPKGTLLIEGDYSVESVAWLIASLSTGWQVVPVVSNKRSIIEARARIADATHCVSHDASWRLAELPGNDVKLTPKRESGVVLFSSGSTGEPKAMCKSVDLSPPSATASRSRSTTMALLLLFDHIGGLNTLLSGIKKGSHMVAPLERNPRTMGELIERYSIRTLPCSPTFLNMMSIDSVFDDYDFKSLRLITYGTERMPEDLLKSLSEKLPRVKFLQTFGTSETGIVKTKSYSSSSTFLTIDDPNVEWMVVEGELWIRSTSQIGGYLNTSDEAIIDGWFKTGDLVELRDDGFFKVVGRKKEVINVGGEKVLPSEIEDLLISALNIVDCTAFAVMNGITGQSVGVKVVPVKGADVKALKKEIRSLARDKLEPFKVPTKISFESTLKHTDRFKKER